MHVVGSVIARLGSKRLVCRNLQPFEGKPLWGLGIEKLREAKRVDEWDDIPSIPVFQHLVRHYPCDVSVNFNTNFPLCDPTVIDQAVELAALNGESLSRPCSARAQTRACLENYGDLVSISAHNHEFEDVRAVKIDIHTLENHLGTFRLKQSERPAELLDWIHPKMAQGEHSGSR